MSGTLTPAGEAAVAELAQRYHVGEGAVRTLLDAVIRGGGAMAQFSHPELGGNGQWMRGGMTMVGDMFNPGLQATVSGICSELSSLMAAGDRLVTSPERPGAATAFGSVGGGWWPEDLGRPSSSGGQNDAAYAYFPGPRRLAIRRGGSITLYDTGDHLISGVQQQQGGRGSLEFSSQFGSFTVDSLPAVGGDVGSKARRPPNPPAAAPHVAAPPAAPSNAAAPPAAPPHVAAPPAAPSNAAAPAGAAGTAAEIGLAIETLAGLRDKGFLTDEEFSDKKAELLGRL